MKSIVQFDPEVSANKLKVKLQNVNRMTVEIAEELYKARNFYSKSGFRSDLTTDVARLNTFGDYLDYIGLQRRTSERWLERYVPEQNKLLTYEELQKKKQTEAYQKLSTEQKKRTLIDEYKRTGKKPIGWDRSLDYLLQKEQEEEAKREQRVKELKENMRKEQEEKERRRNQDDLFSHTAQKIIDDTIKSIQERQQWKDKIKLSNNGQDDPFMDALMDYLETLADDNRRIEACNNIIKICRNISVELQKVK